MLYISTRIKIESMTTIKVKFTGTNDNLEMFAFSGIQLSSEKTFKSNNQNNNGELVVKWYLEDSTKSESLNYVMDCCINLEQANLWGIEVDAL